MVQFLDKKTFGQLAVGLASSWHFDDSYLEYWYLGQKDTWQITIKDSENSYSDNSNLDNMVNEIKTFEQFKCRQSGNLNLGNQKYNW